MNPIILSILNKNTQKIQRQFYEKINSKPSVSDHIGYVYCASKISDIKNVSNNWIKLGRTERDPHTRAVELKCKLDFYCKTKYNKKCERLIHLLFNCYSVHRLSENNTKQIEWFNIIEDIDINNILVIIAEYVDNYSDKDIENIQEHKTLSIPIPIELEKEPLVFNDDMMNDDKYDDNDMEIALGFVLGGIIIGAFSYILSDNDNISSDIKTGLSSDIVKIIKLLDNEISLYYYTKANIHIILTNMRFLKIEKNNIISESYLYDIQYINHIKNGVFYYDKIEIIEKTSRIETFGIYSKTVCSDFIKLLNKIIKENVNVKPPSYDNIGKENNLT